MVDWNNLLKKTNLKKIIKTNWKKIGLIISILVITIFYIIIINNQVQKNNYVKSVIGIAKRNQLHIKNKFLSLFQE